ncbi:MAG: N-acetylmuramoyl-L-alanine amidase [Sandaracinus sp.]
MAVVPVVVRRALLVVACLVLVSSCASRLGHRRPGEQALLPVDLTVTTAEMTAGWLRDGDYLVSPPLEEEAAASRVGVLVQLAADGEFPPLEARGTEDGDGVTEWVPLGATYSEGDHHVGLAELGTVATGAQLRIPVDALDRVASITWNATIPDEPEPEVAAPSDGAAVAPLTADLMGLGIVTRSSWGAAATRCTTRDARRYRMAVHYTDTPSANPDRQVRSIQRYHMDTRGWCDIGYHFLVGIDGRIFEGRPIELLGAHVSNNNTGNIGVSFIGCFHSTGCGSMGPTTPPDVMLDAGGRLLGTLSRLYGISLDRNAVRGHRDHAGASTDCPGDYLYARIDQLLATGQSHSLGDGTMSMPPPDPTPTPTPTSCGGLACGACAAAAGCGYCASQGACLDAGSACTWTGAVGTSECTDTLYPCATATCWNPTAAFASCGSWSKSEDFSSGSYSVHRYWAHLFPGGVTTITLARTSGTFTPAILVSDRSGRVAYGGEVAALHPSVQVISARSGRGDSSASVSLTAASDLDVYVYVTDWAVLDGAFRGRVSTSARYTLTASEDCGATMPPSSTSTDAYAGLTQSGAEIPRAGLANSTLRATLGVSTEPYGTVVDYHGQSWVSGRVSWFGGPTDTGVGPTETVAISGEVARSLNSPMNPDAATLAAHPERYYYCAMRFAYQPQGTAFWRTARLVLTNPRTGVQVVVRPADWGPHTRTGRIIDLSPQAIADLGLSTDETALVAFARPGTPLGRVR